jgi:hypothetical protein
VYLFLLAANCRLKELFGSSPNLGRVPNSDKRAMLFCLVFKLVYNDGMENKGPGFEILAFMSVFVVALFFANQINPEPAGVFVKSKHL